MELEIMMLNKINQTQKDTYCIFFFSLTDEIHWGNDIPEGGGP